MTSKKVLIVGNPKSQGLPYEKVLGDDGFEVSIFDSVDEALKFMDSNKPDLITLDLKLNGEDSINLIEKFKDKNEKTPIILCSETGKDKQSFQVWASDAYVVKSEDFRDLRLTIKEILG